MKRGGPLRRSTPLRATKRLTSTAPGLSRSGRLRPRSARTAKVYREERVPLHDQLRAERGPTCQFPGCPRAWLDLHEIKRRSRGGSITDPSNILCLCREHHDWVTLNDRAAREAVIVTALLRLWGWPVEVVVLTKHSWED